jgi:hypothetical protein
MENFIRQQINDAGVLSSNEKLSLLICQIRIAYISSWVFNIPLYFT